MIYLGAPYSHTEPWIVENRMRYVERAVAFFSLHGKPVQAPLLLHHCLNTGIKLPSDFEFWESTCRAIWKVSTELVVLTLAGWEESPGLAKELSWAYEDKKPITYLSPKRLYPPHFVQLPEQEQEKRKP